jgi:probable HAF family extracellular repeat protein
MSAGTGARNLHRALLAGTTFLLILPSGSLQAACNSPVCATTPMDLGTLDGDAPGVKSEAFAVSDNGGVVVGSSLIFDPVAYAYVRHAILWQNGAMVDLGTLGGVDAFDVNDTGKVVVGGASTANGGSYAFRWTASTGMLDLGTLNGAVHGQEISSRESRIGLYVIPTDEELMIARHTLDVLSKRAQ